MASLFAFGILLVGISIGTLVSSRSIKKINQELTSSPSPSATVSGEIASGQIERTMVKRVIDGDTIELSDGRKVRYIGIDTPETVDPRRPVGCFGKEASEKNRELVLNKPVELEKDISETDKYQRLLRYVYVELEGKETMVNQYLVETGFATSDTFPPDVKYQEKFRQAETEARNKNLGLWGSCRLNSSSPVSVTSPVVKGVTSLPALIAPVPTVGQTTSVSETGCLIKGNISSTGKIYHLPGCGSYDKTVIDESSGEHWFCSEEEAQKAGWRKAKNC